MEHLYYAAYVTIFFLWYSTAKLGYVEIGVRQKFTGWCRIIGATLAAGLLATINALSGM